MAESVEQTESGYRRVNYSCTGPEPTNQKLSGKYYKRKTGSTPKCRLQEQRTDSVDHLMFGGSRGVMVIVVGIGHGDTSSNPGRD